jgi:hypothetical protein
MFQKQLFHSRTVVEELFHDSQNFVSILKMSCEEVDIEDNVDKRDICERN